MALLDTTVFVDLEGRGGKRRKAEAQEMLRQIMQTGESLVTSRVNLAELYVGLELSDDPLEERAAIANYLAWVAVLELDDAAARQFGRIRAELQRRGKLIGDLDLLIAGVALANGEAVVTRNHDHFSSVPGLKVIDYGT